MSTLRFTDGEVFDLSGPIRKDERYDGWYVIGEGQMIPVRDEKEADEVIDKYYRRLIRFSIKFTK